MADTYGVFSIKFLPPKKIRRFPTKVRAGKLWHAFKFDLGSEIGGFYLDRQMEVIEDGSNVTLNVWPGYHPWDKRTIYTGPAEIRNLPGMTHFVLIKLTEGWTAEIAVNTP